jgi:two-component system NtrC family sensor kinase
VTPLFAAATVGRRLLWGLIALFAVSALATGLALSSTRAVEAELVGVERLAEESRRLGRVGSLFREYYMHQAHLALGMDMAEHTGMTRRAHADLVAALDAVERLPDARFAPSALPGLRAHLATLDRLFDGEFLPALAAGHAGHAAHVHHRAAGTVQEVTALLDAEEIHLSEAIAAARARAGRAATAATTQSALFLGSALGLALLVAAWMSRTIQRPVERLRAAAAALPHAPPGARVPEDGPLEVAQLGRTLNAVLADLEAQRRARGEAETLAALGRIAAGVAHEINNPLGVVLGHARVLERALDADEADSARAIAQEARHCQHIVQDLLDYARPALAARAPVDLVELARAAAERVSVPVAFDGTPDVLTVWADARRLSAVLRNLLDNAAAFGRAVSVSWGLDADVAVLRVRDDGPGVPATHLERVFEPFFTTRPEGTGLGLAIARAIATAHGGDLRAHAGPGGHFELRLPIGASTQD